MIAVAVKGAEEREVGADDETKRTASTFAVLRRNPDLVKAMLASALQRSALMVSAVLGVQNLRALVWGEHTAEYTARLSMCMSVVAMVSAGMFGRMGDRLGRRTAAAIYGFTSFLPSWTLLVFGFNKVGLYASCAAFLLSGIGLCSDAVLVLANDVTREEDRGMAFGLYQAATNGGAFLFFGLPSCLTVLFKILPNPSINQWLWYNFMLTAVYFGIIFSVRAPRQLAAPATASTPMTPSEPSDVEFSVDAETPLPRSRPPVTEADGCVGLLRRWIQNMPMIRELRMMNSDPNLRKLYLTGALLFFSGDVVFDLGSQYFRDNLDLIPPDNLSEEQRMELLDSEQLVSVLTTLPPELGIIPGALFVAFLAKRLGSLWTLRIMIPIAALMTAGGAMMAVVPAYWIIPVVCLFMNYASLASNVPLKHLLTAAAPEGKTGEAMASLGMLNQAVCFFANALVMVVTPILYRYLEKPLWIAYLFSGFMTVLGSFTILGLKIDDGSNGSSTPSQMSGKDAGDSRKSHALKKVTFNLDCSSESDAAADAGGAAEKALGDDGAPLGLASCGDLRSLRSLSATPTTAASMEDDEDEAWQPRRRECRAGTMDSTVELMNGSSPEVSPAHDILDEVASPMEDRGDFAV